MRSHIGGATTIGVEGSEEDRLRAREQLLREQRLRIAQRAGWPELPRAELVFGRYFVEHEPSGDLYHPMRGEVSEGFRDAAHAYYLMAGGEPMFLKRPQTGPRTRAELEARRRRA